MRRIRVQRAEWLLRVLAVRVGVVGLNPPAVLQSHQAPRD